MRRSGRSCNRLSERALQRPLGPSPALLACVAYAHGPLASVRSIVGLAAFNRAVAANARRMTRSCPRMLLATSSLPCDPQAHAARTFGSRPVAHVCREGWCFAITRRTVTDGRRSHSRQRPAVACSLNSTNMLCYVAMLYNMKTAGLYRLHVGLDYCGRCGRFELYNQTTGKEYTAKFRQARPPRRWKQHSVAAFAPSHSASACPLAVAEPPPVHTAS